jgi:protein-tyrosine phosphatase
VIDLHSHLLPGLDDGSRSLEQSVRVLAEFAAVGITDVVMTPHLRASQIGAGGERAIELRDRGLEELRRAAPGGVRLHPGFEIMLDQPLDATVAGDRRYALAGSRYYLVEFPISVVGTLAADILQRIGQSGVVPLVAHPERYHLCTAQTVDLWRTVGAAIQVDATALTRPNSRGEAARRLLARGWADVIAADNHGDRRTMVTGRRFLSERGGEDAAEWLSIQNPRAVIDDAPLMPVPAVRFRRGILERVRGWLDGQR